MYINICTWKIYARMGYVASLKPPFPNLLAKSARLPITTTTLTSVEKKYNSAVRNIAFWMYTLLVRIAGLRWKICGCACVKHICAHIQRQRNCVARCPGQTECIIFHINLYDHIWSPKTTIYRCMRERVSGREREQERHRTSQSPSNSPDMELWAFVMWHAECAAPCSIVGDVYARMYVSFSLSLTFFSFNIVFRSSRKQFQRVQLLNEFQLFSCLSLGGFFFFFYIWIERQQLAWRNDVWCAGIFRMILCVVYSIGHRHSRLRNANGLRLCSHCTASQRSN